MPAISMHAWTNCGNDRQTRDNDDTHTRNRGGLRRLVVATALADARHLARASTECGGVEGWRSNRRSGFARSGRQDAKAVAMAWSTRTAEFLGDMVRTMPEGNAATVGRANALCRRAGDRRGTGPAAGGARLSEAHRH